MDIELREHVGRKVGTNKRVVVQQHRLFVDGVAAGYVPFAEGSKILFIRNYEPEQAAEIEKRVAEMLERESIESKQPPKLPEGYMKQQETEVAIDDFSD